MNILGGACAGDIYNYINTKSKWVINYIQAKVTQKEAPSQLHGYFDIYTMAGG